MGAGLQSVQIAIREAHAVLAVGVTIGSGDPCTLRQVVSAGESKL